MLLSFKSGSNKTKFNYFLFQNISKNLLDEIKAFGEIASGQRARLEVRKLLVFQQCFVLVGLNYNRKRILSGSSFKQEIRTVMTELSKSREQMIKEREMFSQETTEMEKALKEAETLLL